MEKQCFMVAYNGLGNNVSVMDNEKDKFLNNIISGIDTDDNEDEKEDEKGNEKKDDKKKDGKDDKKKDDKKKDEKDDKKKDDKNKKKLSSKEIKNRLEELSKFNFPDIEKEEKDYNKLAQEYVDRVKDIMRRTLALNVVLLCVVYDGEKLEKEKDFYDEINESLNKPLPHDRVSRNKRVCEHSIQKYKEIISLSKDVNDNKNALKKRTEDKEKELDKLKMECKEKEYVDGLKKIREKCESMISNLSELNKKINELDNELEDVSIMSGVNSGRLNGINEKEQNIKSLQNELKSKCEEFKNKSENSFVELLHNKQIIKLLSKNNSTYSFHVNKIFVDVTVNKVKLKDLKKQNTISNKVKSSSIACIFKAEI